MNSEKGITLLSLAIYIMLVLIVLGILTTVTTNFTSKIGEENQEGTQISEINKFNMYFLQEVKKNENEVDYISNTKDQITFKTGNTYIYNSEEQIIYLENLTNNSKIEIANKIEKCEFSQKIENGKTIVTITIKAKDTEEKVNEYVLTSSTLKFNYEDETTYFNSNLENQV